MGDLLPFPRAHEATSSRRDAKPWVPPAHQHIARPGQPEPLWREAAGRVLREQRHRREQTLAQVADRAGISVQYLSEVERGRKEPSSEVLSAVAGALELTLVDLTRLVLAQLAPLDVTSQRSDLPGPFSRPGRPGGPVALAG